MTVGKKQRVMRRRSVLKTGLSVAVGSATLSVVSRRAAAHFPDELAIDIKPGGDRNSIARNCQGVVPVAVLYTTFEDDGTTVFDPTDRAVRYRFGAPETVESGGGARPVHGGHTEDVNGEEHDALVLHFPVEQTGFGEDSSVGKLLWEREENGEHGYSGTGRVRIIG